MAETSMRQVWVCNEEVQSFDMMSFLPRGLYATFSTTYRALSCSPSALVEPANERRKVLLRMRGLNRFRCAGTRAHSYVAGQARAYIIVMKRIYSRRTVALSLKLTLGCKICSYFIVCFPAS